MSTVKFALTGSDGGDVSGSFDSKDVYGLAGEESGARIYAALPGVINIGGTDFKVASIRFIVDAATSVVDDARQAAGDPTGKVPLTDDQIKRALAGEDVRANP